METKMKEKEMEMEMKMKFKEEEKEKEEDNDESPPHKKLKESELKQEQVLPVVVSEENSDDEEILIESDVRIDDLNLDVDVCDYECIDASKAIPITVDLQRLQQEDFLFENLSHFTLLSYNKHTLQMYDHPGYPRTGIFYHMEGKRTFHRAPAEYAFDWYRDQYPHGSEIVLKEVTKMSCRPGRYLYFFVTFTVVDTKLNKETTLQAQVLEHWVGSSFTRKWLLGMLRDASHDQVLAAIKFEKASAGLLGDLFWNGVLDHLPEKIFVKT